MTYTATHHQGVTEIFWLHFCGPLWLSIYLIQSIGKTSFKRESLLSFASFVKTDSFIHMIDISPSRGRIFFNNMVFLQISTVELYRLRSQDSSIVRRENVNTEDSVEYIDLISPLSYCIYFIICMCC